MNARRSLSFALLAVLSMLAAPGCESVQDTVARMAGAPTSADFEAERAKIVEAESRVADAEQARAALARELDAQRRAEADLALQRDALEAQYAAMAGQLVNLTGEARRALIEIMDSYRRRMDVVGDQQRQQAEIVSRYAAELAEADGVISDAHAVIAQGEESFDALIEQRDAAFAGLSGAVNTLAATAVSLGAPEPVVQQGKGIFAAGIGLLTGAGPTGALAWYMRRKAANRKKIIQTTERYDLLDSADPTRKAEAKAALSPAEAAELAKITAPVAKIARTSAVSGAAA